MREKLSLRKDVNGCKNKAIKGRTDRIWLINYSSDVSKGRMQRSVAIIVTSGMKNPLKKHEFSQFLPRFQALPLETFDNTIRKYSPTTCFNRLIEVTVIRDADKANQIRSQYICLVIEIREIITTADSF